MDITVLKRDPKRIAKALVTRGKRTLATETLRLMFPEYYIKREIAVIGSDNYVIGLFALITEDNHYSTVNVPAMISIGQGSLTRTKVGEMVYCVLEFEAGESVIDSDEVVKNELLTYPIFNDVLGKGQIPWYMNDQNTGYVLDGARRYMGSSIGDDRKSIQTIMSLLSRDPKNPTDTYRHSVKTFADVDTKRPLYSSIRNVQYMASNTFTKQAGSYFSAGTNSSLITTTTTIEPVERALR